MLTASDHGRSDHEIARGGSHHRRIFALAGYAIGHFTGNTTEEGFALKGGPAFLLFAVIILYFIIFRRFLGGTVFQRLLGAR
jgi:hypothetical protein